MCKNARTHDVICADAMSPVEMASSINLILATYLILGNNGCGAETPCYSELGCFSMEDPWCSLTRPFPKPHSPEKINVQLYCFTRANPPLRYTVSVWPEISLNGWPYTAEKKTVFITHGFATNGNETWLHTFKDLMLQQVDATVCIVDWGSGAKLFNYFQVASNTRIVGAVVARKIDLNGPTDWIILVDFVYGSCTRFIQYLQLEHKLQPKDVHLIGHSLGAHICSYIAKRVSGIARLTALDPAQPGFEMEDKRVRLDKSDANFIDTVHTNALPILPFLGFGMMNECGHVDIYMNGGGHQPGCILPNFTEITSFTDLAKFSVEAIMNLVSCSHGRAIEYYMNVLSNNCTIWARKAKLITNVLNVLTLGLAEELLSSTEPCTANDCIHVGLEAFNDPARGTFCAETTINAPFCDNHETVKRISAEIKASQKKNEEVHAADAVKSIFFFDLNKYDDNNPCCYMCFDIKVSFTRNFQSEDGTLMLKHVYKRLKQRSDDKENAV